MQKVYFPEPGGFSLGIRRMCVWSRSKSWTNAVHYNLLRDASERIWPIHWKKNMCYHIIISITHNIHSVFRWNSFFALNSKWAYSFFVVCFFFCRFCRNFFFYITGWYVITTNNCHWPNHNWISMQKTTAPIHSGRKNLSNYWINISKMWNKAKFNWVKNGFSIISLMCSRTYLMRVSWKGEFQRHIDYAKNKQ